MKLSTHPRGFSFPRFLSTLLIAAFSLQSAGPSCATPERGWQALRQAQPEASSRRGGLEEALSGTAQSSAPPLRAGLEEKWGSISQPLGFITEPALHAEAEAVLRLALSDHGKPPDHLVKIPPAVGRLTAPENILDDPGQLQDLGRRALIEWMAYRWAYQRRGPASEYYDTLGTMIRSIVHPDHAPEFLQQARAMGIPVEAYPANFTARTAGIIFPMYALRSEADEGIGDMEAATRYMDIAAGQGLRQVYFLPIFETDQIDPSPYYTLSAFGGNPLHIALRAVPEVLASSEAGVRLAELQPRIQALHQQERMDYPEAARIKWEVLRLAYAHFRDHVLGKDPQRTKAFEAFKRGNAYWLKEYAVFRTLSDHHKTGWRNFPSALKNRDPEALAQWEAGHADGIQMYAYVQFLFQGQWDRMRRRAHELGIRIVTDMPGYVDGDAGWMYHGYFDRHWTTGAAADRYSVVGQDWGHHPYNWEEMRRYGYPLAINRIRRVASLGDDVRMDYWVGYATYFRIPLAADERKWRRESLAEMWELFRQAWDTKFGPEPLPLVPVADRETFYRRIEQALLGERLYPAPAGVEFDRADFARRVVEIIRRQKRCTWAPNEPRYQSPALLWTGGTFGDLTGAETQGPQLVEQVLADLPEGNPVREAVIRECQRKSGRGDLEIWIHTVMRFLDAGWADGPGHDLMQRFQEIVTYEHLGQMIPEDFGEGFPKAQQLRRELGFPRIRLLGYGAVDRHPPYWNTEEHHSNSALFTTTHDGNTLIGMFSGAKQRPLLTKGMRGRARQALYMYQDWFELDERFRTTPPGEALGEKWRDRMPFTIEAMERDQDPQVQEINRLIRETVSDPQAGRLPAPVQAGDHPRVLGMYPSYGNEDGVRVVQIRHPGEKIQAWAVVARSRAQESAGTEPRVEMALWRTGEPMGNAHGFRMRLHAVLEDGARLYYGEAPTAEMGDHLIRVRVFDRDGSLHWGPEAFQEATVRVLPAPPAAPAAMQPAVGPSTGPGAGLEELTDDRLTESFIHYRSGLDYHNPREQFEKSRSAAALGVAVEQGLGPFTRFFHQVTRLVEHDRIGTADVSRLFSHFLEYYPTLREKIHLHLVHIAVLAHDSAPAATRLAIDTLLSMDVGEVVLASVESGYSSLTGGQGVYVEELSRALANRGINVTVVTPAFSDDWERILARHRPEDTGRTVRVPFANQDGVEWVPLRLWQSRVGRNVRVLYLREEAPRHFVNLKQMYTPDPSRSLRCARLVSNGTLRAIQAMNIHASAIQTNDGYTSYLARYLNEGDDVDPGAVFREDERLSRAGTLHVIHAAARGYQLSVHPSSPGDRTRQERDARIYHDLGWKPQQRETESLIHPEDPAGNSLSAMRCAVAHSDYVVTVSGGYLEWTLQWENNHAIEGMVPVLSEKRQRGRYLAISNGSGVVERQKALLTADPQQTGASPLEMGHQEARERFARHVSSAVHPRWKVSLQYEMGLPQDTETFEAFLYSLPARIEPLKGHPLLTATLWSVWEPGVLRLHGTDPDFEGDPRIDLPAADKEALTAYAQAEAQRGFPRDFLNALEVACVLMPDLQVAIVGPPGDEKLREDLVNTIDRVNTPQRKRIGYVPEFVARREPWFRAIFAGSTVIGQPSQMESYGLVAREAEAAGIPSHRSRRGGLRDGEIQVPPQKPELAEGFEPYHPIGWLWSLRHMYNVFKGNRPLWEQFKLAAMTADNRWIRPSVNYRELYLRIRSEHGYVGGRPDAHTAIELPVFEVTAVLNRAQLQATDPADEIVRGGFELRQAADILVRGLQGTQDEVLAQALVDRYLPLLAAMPELGGYLGSALQGAEETASTERLRKRFHQAREAAYGAGLEEPAPAEAPMESRFRAGEISWDDLVSGVRAAAESRQPVAVLFNPALVPGESDGERHDFLIDLGRRLPSAFDWPQEIPLVLGLQAERYLFEEAGYRIVEVAPHPESSRRALPAAALPVVVAEALGAFGGRLLINVGSYDDLQGVTLPEILSSLTQV